MSVHAAPVRLRLICGPPVTASFGVPTRALASRSSSPYARATAVAAHAGVFLLVFGLAALAPASGLAQVGGTQDTVSVAGREIIRPGDTIRLRVWREPDLSGDFAVDVGAVATLPRLGPVQVGSMTPDSLRRYVLTEFAKYLRNPTVEVTVLRRSRSWGPSATRASTVPTRP